MHKMYSDEIDHELKLIIMWVDGKQTKIPNFVEEKQSKNGTVNHKNKLKSISIKGIQS